MTKQEAFYILGNIPIPTDDTSYDICQYQEAKAIALDCIQKVDDLSEHDKQIRDSVFDECIKEIQKMFVYKDNKGLPHYALFAYLELIRVQNVLEQLKEQNK